MRLNRREFLRRGLALPPTIAGLWAGLSLASCGDDGSTSANESELSTCSDTGDCDDSGDFNVAIASNHGHTLTLTQAEVDAGAEITIVVTDNGDHAHAVTLTAAMLADVAAGLKLRLLSTGAADGHSHCITVNCSVTSSGGGGGYYQA